MQMICLASTGRMTSRLGFGGSSLMGLLNRRQSIAMLESAYDAGIRHFDTAPSYGHGEAEDCLGEFLARHRSDCTVTTKFGIPPGKNRVAVRLARALVAPVVLRSPALKRQLRSSMQTGHKVESTASVPSNPIFTASEARSSIEASLRKLKADRVDILLLHEVKAIDLVSDSADDPLLNLLESLVAAGTIGAFGVGSERNLIAELIAKHPLYCSVVQTEWSVFNEIVPGKGSFRIHHRSLFQNFQSLPQQLRADPKNLKRWSDEVGEDLADSEKLAALFLKASLVMNPGSIVLFSSKRPHHIRTNVEVAGNPALEAPAIRLYQLVHRERSSAPGF